MDRFYIITNSDKDKKLEITEKIADYLKTHHKNCEVQQAERKHEGSFHYTDLHVIFRNKFFNTGKCLAQVVLLFTPDRLYTLSGDPQRITDGYTDCF